MVEKDEFKPKKTENQVKNVIVSHLETCNGEDRAVPYTETKFVVNKICRTWD